VLPKLAKTHRVVAIEQQGHGHTADIDRPLAFEQMADDTNALLAQLDIAQADVFGFSNGGNVALQLAIRHPERVKRLVVGSAFFENEGLVPEVRAMFSRPADAASVPAQLREDYMRTAPVPGNLQLLTEKIMAMLSGFKNWPIESLHGISAPTLVLQGNFDVAKPEHALAMCRAIPHCELVMLPGGHGTYLGEVTAARAGSQLPDVTVTLIEEHLRTSPGKTP
jgi:pimeloyl-ACP methyl ester carboxylesterase